MCPTKFGRLNSGVRTEAEKGRLRVEFGVDRTADSTPGPYLLGVSCSG